MRVYLSSTLNDLVDERAAAREALVTAGHSVLESYTASESSLRASVLEDVAQCDAYVLILGLRYGFVPDAATNVTSITELEYEQAKAKGLKRLVFLKRVLAITGDKIDALTGEHPKERIEGFRARFTTGSDDEPRGAEFSTAADLKYAVVQALARLRQEKAGSTPLLGGQVEHPWLVRYDTTICALPGTDDDLNLAALKELDRRLEVFTIIPQPEREYVAELDRYARRSRCLMLVLRPQSLSRLKPHVAVVNAALKALQSRTKVFALLVDLAPEALPPELAGAFDDRFESTAADWSPAGRDATFTRLTRWRRERIPEAISGPRIGVPYLVVALTQAEAAEMAGDTDTLFARFEPPAAAVRRTVFDGLRASLAASGLTWPTGFYGEPRADWRPFGPGTPSIESLVGEAAKKVNMAPQGSRERRVLLQAQLVPQRYRLEEYLQDAFGSAENLRRVCEEGCLVMVDEFALLHPDLRPRIDKLLSSNNAAVACVSACDPAYRSLRNLLDEFSYLRVGNLFLRFCEAEDVRCELGINSLARLQRWVRFVLPELMVTLGHEQSVPSLVERAADLLSTN
jgi:hypothetical protein